jgi:hypothetical protein
MPAQKVANRAPERERRSGAREGRAQKYQGGSLAGVGRGG